MVVFPFSFHKSESVNKQQSYQSINHITEVGIKAGDLEKKQIA